MDNRNKLIAYASNFNALYGDIDVIVDVRDLENLKSISASLALLFIDFSFGKGQLVGSHVKKFVLIKFRKHGIYIDDFKNWKDSKEEIEVCKDLEFNEKNVPCVCKDWCDKFDTDMYTIALKALYWQLDINRMSNL